MTPPSGDDQMVLLRTADERQVVRRLIFSNSGPGTVRWFLGTEVATGYQAALLTGLHRAGFLMEESGGRMTLSARGHIRLTLHDS